MKPIWQKQFCIYTQQFYKSFARRNGGEEIHMLKQELCFFCFEVSKGN